MLKYVEIEEILDSVTIPDVEFSSTDEALCVLVKIRKERNKLIRVLKALVRIEELLQEENERYIGQKTRGRQTIEEVYSKDLEKIKTVSGRNEFIEARVGIYITEELKKSHRKLELVQQKVKFVQVLQKELEMLYAVRGSSSSSIWRHIKDFNSD